MAGAQYPDPGSLRSYATTSDLSAARGKAVTWNGTTLAVAGANQRHIFGVLVDDPKSGAAGTVQTRGMVVARSGASFSAGALLATDASGRFVTATTGQFVQALAIDAAGAADVYVTVELGPQAVAP